MEKDFHLKTLSSTVDFFMKKYGFPNSFKSEMGKTTDALSEKDIKKLLSFYPSPAKLDFNGLKDEVKRLSDAYKIDLRTLNLFTFTLLTPKLFDFSAAAGVKKSVTIDTVRDFKCKYDECKRVCGIDGIRQWDWYKNFFTLKLFALGRLQFEIRPFNADVYKKDGRILRRGEPALAVHIPQTGEPLLFSECEKSYALAKAFFKTHFNELFGGDYVPFTCNSWLLYPENRDILPKTSNVLRFAERFNLVEWGEFDDFNAISPWVFDKERIEDPADIPENTAMQRALKRRLKDGKKLGWGFGAFFF